MSQDYRLCLKIIDMSEVFKLYLFIFITILQLSVRLSFFLLAWYYFFPFFSFFFLFVILSFSFHFLQFLFHSFYLFFSNISFLFWNWLFKLSLRIKSCFFFLIRLYFSSHVVFIFTSWMGSEYFKETLIPLTQFFQGYHFLFCFILFQWKFSEIKRHFLGLTVELYMRYTVIQLFH